MVRVAVEELAQLFEGRTRFVERLAQLNDPLAHARELLRTLPQDEIIEVLNAHPRIGAHRLSAASEGEQGTDDDPAVLTALARLNAQYEGKFGFRFVVFVNRRSRRDILSILRHRLQRPPDKELATAIDDVVSIAEDRYQRLHAAGGG